MSILVCLTCSITFIISFGFNQWKLEALQFNEMVGPSTKALIKVGAIKSDLVVHNKQWYRLLTAMFVNAGVIHYVPNMVSLWMFGCAIENYHGFRKAATIFFISGIGGSILSTIYLPQHVIVGTSGAIMGLMGACVADIWINMWLLFDREVNEQDPDSIYRNMKAMPVLILEIVLYFLLGHYLNMNIDNFAHGGGMLIGFMAGLFLLIDIPPGFFGKDEGNKYVMKRVFEKCMGGIGIVVYFVCCGLRLSKV